MGERIPDWMPLGPFGGCPSEDAGACDRLLLSIGNDGFPDDDSPFRLDIEDLPDHLCYFTLLWSTQAYVRQERGAAASSLPWSFDWAEEWPLPVRARTVEQWVREHLDHMSDDDLAEPLSE